MSKKFEVKFKGKSKPQKGVYDIKIIPYIHGTFKRYELNGKIHREDGPAVVPDWGQVEWYLDGKELTFDEWLATTNANGWTHDRNEMLLKHYTSSFEQMISTLSNEHQALIALNKRDGLVLPMLEQFAKRRDFIHRENFLSFIDYVASKYHNSMS